MKRLPTRQGLGVVSGGGCRGRGLRSAALAAVYLRLALGSLLAACNGPGLAPPGDSSSNSRARGAPVGGPAAPVTGTASGRGGATMGGSAGTASMAPGSFGNPQPMMPAGGAAGAGDSNADNPGTNPPPPAAGSGGMA